MLGVGVWRLQQSFVSSPPTVPKEIFVISSDLASLCYRFEIPSIVRPATVAAISNLLMALPAHAEAGKIFDFNLTLPIMAGQFLLLMVFLDKFWFGPVGKLLDERDELLRSKLASVKEGGNEIGDLQAEAERILQEARTSAAKLIQDTKAATNAEQAAKLAALKKVSFKLDCCIWVAVSCDFAADSSGTLMQYVFSIW